MSTNINTLDRLRLELAGATKECPAVHSTENNQCGEHLCGGTGSVFALPDAVRVPCDMEERLPAAKDFSPLGHYVYSHPNNCSHCYGRLYTPSTDLVVWLEATLSFLGKDGFIEIDSEGVAVDGHSRLWSDGKPEEALLSALMQVLKAQGCTMGEVP